MDASETCRVDGCERRAAASMIRESLPGPLPLCATHTEDFRMNGAGWVVAWEHTLTEPTSVKPAAPAPVGRSASGLGSAPQSHNSKVSRVRSRLVAWRNSR
jgi:hypothetical protein